MDSKELVPSVHLALLGVMCIFPMDESSGKHFSWLFKFSEMHGASSQFFEMCFKEIVDGCGPQQNKKNKFLEPPYSQALLLL